MGILAYLAAHPGQVITRKALIHAVWGVHADVKSRSLDQYVVKVRELFKDYGLDLAPFPNRARRRLPVRSQRRFARGALNVRGRQEAGPAALPL